MPPPRGPGGRVCFCSPRPCFPPLLWGRLFGFGNTTSLYTQAQFLVPIFQNSLNRGVRTQQILCARFVPCTSLFTRAFYWYGNRCNLIWRSMGTFAWAWRFTVGREGAGEAVGLCRSQPWRVTHILCVRSAVQNLLLYWLFIIREVVGFWIVCWNFLLSMVKLFCFDKNKTENENVWCDLWTF